MKINQKGSLGTSGSENRILHTLIDQVSALQIDVEQVKDEEDRLDNAKLDKESIDKETANPIDAKFKDLEAENVECFGIEADHIESTGLVRARAIHTDVVVADNIECDDSANIKEISSINIGTSVLNANRTNVGDGGLKVTGDTDVKDLTAEDVQADSVNTGNLITKNEAVNNVNVIGYTDNNNVYHKGTANVEYLKATEAEIDSLKATVSNFIGETINAEELLATFSNIDKIKTGSIVMSNINEYIPVSTYLEPNDTYTLELPIFTGTYYLVWKDSNTTFWSAVVTGNGHDYTVTWNSTDKENFAVLELFQAENKLYIRHNANGVLYFLYVATKELPGPNIYKNMNGWNGDTLEDLTDEKTHYVCTVPSGTFTFGNFFAPGYTILGAQIFDDIEVNKLKVNEELTVVPQTIKWNDTDVKVCDNFTTDWVL